MSEQIYRASVIIRESLPVLFGVLIFSLFTGNNLEGASQLIVQKFVIVLIALPAFINMEGDLAAVFTARLTSHLFVGTLSKRFRPYKILLTDLAAVLAVALTGFVFVSGMTIFLDYLIFATNANSFVILVTFVFAGTVSTLAMCLVGLSVAYFSFSRGLNPGNVTSPLTTTLGDAFGTFLLIVTIRPFVFA